MGCSSPKTAPRPWCSITGLTLSRNSSKMIGKTYDIVLAADPVPPEEIYETCDQCKDLFMPFMTFFDGKQFLCADCRKRASGRSARA